MRVRQALINLALVLLLMAMPATVAAGSRPVTVTGGGWFLFGDAVPIQFGFGALVRGDGSVSGSFHQAYEVDGLYVRYWGSLTCLTYDEDNARAWVGGVLTKVESNDPEVTQVPGEDAWFRVLDGGLSGDRSTLIGFVGIFPSSAEYCLTKPWPDENARTHPVVSGQINLSVSPT